MEKRTVINIPLVITNKLISNESLSTPPYVEKHSVNIPLVITSKVISDTNQFSSESFSIAGIIASSVIGVVLYNKIKLKIDEKGKTKLLEKIHPFINEITNELHELYVKYTAVMKFLYQYNIEKKLKEFLLTKIDVHGNILSEEKYV